MAELTGLSEEEIAVQLKGVIFRVLELYHTDAPPRYVTADEYLSGNVHEKLRTAELAAYATYGTDRANAYKIFEDTLNLRDVRIYDTKTEPDGKEIRVLNINATQLAQQKQQLIKDAFKDWIVRDADRPHTLMKLYNERFNSVRR